MKRLRFGGEEEAEFESISMANVLMLLSRGGGGEGGGEADQPEQSSASRVFECKTCNRRFRSFQALGGHRTSHKKPRVEGQVAEVKPRVHECSVCGLEFGIGQALGGHMRRHRAAAAVAGGFGKKEDGRRRGLWLDLNLPPSSEEEKEMESRKMGFGLEIVDKIRMVDCLH